LDAVSFVHSSWFDSLDESLRGRVDLIVANPPYIGEVEFADLDPVLRYEPHGALVAQDARGVQGFSDVDTIIRDAITWLTTNGALICEHSDTHRRHALELAQEVGYQWTQDLDDLAGKPRILVARR
jgi:release factor glutamine methyltransferase